MLCMPEFDTYNAIQRYAKRNNDPAAVLAYVFLKTRTERQLMWRAVSLGLPDLKAALDLTMGITNKPSSNNPASMADMSEEQRRKLYDAACKQAGIQLDPSALTK